MRIELLVVPGCANEATAADRLRRALDEAGLADTGFTTRVITTVQEAEQAGFTGSPTILIDGRDPFAQPTALPAVACRIYRTAHGVEGAPDLEQLGRVLRDTQTRQPST